MKRKAVTQLLALSLGLAVLCAQPGLGYLAKASEITEEETTDVEETDDNISPEEAGDRANSFRYQDGEPIETPASALRAASANAWKRVIASDGTVTCYNGNGDKIPNATMKGIDVSKWQGKIDWAKVKKADVDFAIVRAGYGQNLTSQDDAYWLTNAKACETQGIPYGAYIYSYAKTVTAAEGEADHVLRLVKGRNLSLPIYYDMEDADTQGTCSASQLAKIAKAFCDKIEAAGYKAAIYANLNWFTTKLTNSYFDTQDRWCAQYNNTGCTLLSKYNKTYNIWQSSSTGSVSGISGNVDLNFAIGTSVLAPVTKVTMSKTPASVEAGSVYQLSVSVKPLNATNKNVTWSSSDKTVATVTSAGKVTAVAAGTATITAKAKDGSGVKATCKITVPAAEDRDTETPETPAADIPATDEVTSLKLSKTSMTLAAGASAAITKTIIPSSASSATVTWKTSSSSIAKVSSAGKVTAVAPGKATITATAGQKSTTCTVYVVPKATASLAYTAKSTNTVQLTWKKVSGAAGYTIYRYNASTKKNVAIHTSGSTAASYTVSRLNGSTGSALSAGTSYTFRIAPYKTIDGKKYYGALKSVTATTKCKAPAVSKVSRASSTKAKVTWKKVTGATGYVVYYSTKKSSGYKAAATVSNKTVSYTKAGLKKGKTYYFKVCAYRKVGSKTIYSNYSSVKSIKM